MTDADLSKSLALAIGWQHARQRFSTDIAEVSELGSLWRPFDYRSPDVVLPLIEWLMREYGGFFTRDIIGPHQVWYLPRCFPSMPDRSYPTLAEAVAKACIALKVGHD